MVNHVTGVVRRIGHNYANGTLRLEVHIPIKESAQLPTQMGIRVPVHLLMGKNAYSAGLRATVRNKYAWICPDIYSHGEKRTLGSVLTSEGFHPNQRIELGVDGTLLTITRQQDRQLNSAAELPGLRGFELGHHETEAFHSHFTLVKRDIDLERCASPSHDASLRELRDVAGIYFLTMRIGTSTYKIYVGKTRSLPRRVSDYSKNFQVHAPNDFKLRCFQAYIKEQFPLAVFDLYFAQAGLQGYTSDETEAEKLYRPLINQRADTSAEDKLIMKRAFENHYSTIFSKRLGYD